METSTRAGRWSAWLLLLLGIASYGWGQAQPRLLEMGSSKNRELVVYQLSAADPGYRVDTTGTTDVTTTLQRLIDDLQQAGGGVLFLPSGQYRIDGTVVVKRGVTVRGVWAPPGQPRVGGRTIIRVTQARANQGLEADGTFKLVGHAAGVRNLTFWYPDQRPEAIVAYPPALQITKIGGLDKPAKPFVWNITLINAYYGLYFGPLSSGNPSVLGLYGTVLKTGIKLAESFGGASFFESIHLSPDYWSDSGLTGAPAPMGPHRAWMAANGIGVEDFSSLSESTLSGYQLGIATDGRGDPGRLYRVEIRDCAIALDFRQNNFDRQWIQQCYFGGREWALRLGSIFYMPYTLWHSVTFAGRVGGAQLQPNTHIFASHCRFEAAVALAPSVLEISNSTFVGPTTTLATSDSTIAQLLSCTFSSGATPPPAREQLTIVPASSAGLPLPELPVLGYEAPGYGAGAANLVVVTVAPFGADPTAQQDASAAIQRAIDTAAARGGGVVYFPPGRYRIDRVGILVHSGVELRGSYGGAHGVEADGYQNDRDQATVGTVLEVYGGQTTGTGTTAPAVFDLQAHSGVRGFSVVYPRQNAQAILSYSFTFRGHGAGIYLLDLATETAYNFLDLASAPCDRHWLENLYIWAGNDQIRVGAGSTGGRILRVLSKGGYPGGDERQNETWGADNRDPLLAGWVQDQIVYATYSRGAFSLLRTLPDQAGPDITLCDVGGESLHNFILGTPNAHTARIRATFIDAKVNRGTDFSRERLLLQAEFAEPASGSIDLWNAAILGNITNLVRLQNAQVRWHNSFLECSRILARQLEPGYWENVYFSLPLAVVVDSTLRRPLVFQGAVFQEGLYFDPRRLPEMAQQASTYGPNTRVFLDQCLYRAGKFFFLPDSLQLITFGLRPVVDLPERSAHTWATRNFFEKGESEKAEGKNLPLWCLRQVLGLQNLAVTYFQIDADLPRPRFQPSVFLGYSFYDATGDPNTGTMTLNYLNAGGRTVRVNERINDRKTFKIAGVLASDVDLSAANAFWLENAAPLQYFWIRSNEQYFRGPVALPTATPGALAPEVKIFPNPTQDWLQVDGLKGPVQLRLIAPWGQVVWTGEADLPAAVVPLQGLSAGNYWLEITALDGTRRVWGVVKQ